MIRHGQASFGKENYDKLSDTGVKQSVLLGKYLASAGVKFDSVYSGSLTRQVETLDGISEGYSAEGLSLPEMQEHKGFDEYDSEGIVKKLIPDLVRKDPSLQKDVENIFNEPKSFNRVLEAVMLRWIEGGETPLVKGWADFVNKVNSTLEEVMENEGRRKTLMIVTSGGPLAVAVKRALDLPDEKTMRLVWQIKNSSITRFKYSGDTMMIESFNEVHHLERENLSLITYR